MKEEIIVIKTQFNLSLKNAKKESIMNREKQNTEDRESKILAGSVVLFVESKNNTQRGF